MKVGLCTREYPPDVYGGAGVHVEFLARELENLVDLTVAAMQRANIQGTTEEQAAQLRQVMATVFPEAVTLVREARQGLS